jgi:DNA-binding PadR family transcriptional regulator
VLQDNNLDVGRFIPLSHVSYQVLLSLADHDMHGYGIIKEVSERAGGTIELETGTLYAAIKRLREDNILTVASRKPAPGEDARRRYYKLTPFGRNLLRAETERLADLVAVAQQKRVIACDIVAGDHSPAA